MKRVFELKVKYSDKFLSGKDGDFLIEYLDENGYLLTHYTGNKNTKIENVPNSYRAIKDRFHGKGTVVDIKDVKEI